MATQPGGKSATVVSPPVNAVSLKPVEVPQALQDGEKFIKWDEDSGVGTPVTLRVDKHGFYLYWVDQNHEMDLLDIATIRDTRTGRYAKIPKDSKLRGMVTLGSQDTLEEKTVTVCCASDFVNITFINFCTTRKDIAQLWTDELMQLAYNLTQLNGPTNMFLLKAYTKLSLMMDKTDKVPIKNILKMFAQNKDDRKRVEKALDISGLPSGKNDAISIQKFQFEDFFNFYKNLTQRTEVEKVFDELVGTSKRRLMSATQLVDFLNKTQRDPRLNEILHPYANTTRAKDIIAQYEPNKYNAQRGQFSFDGFLRFLMSEDNIIVAINKLELCNEMDQPLPHYFINSSHNTYLTGHQLTGKSSVEIYRQSLLAGCRCVELDFWNGKTDEPVIVHGYTFVPEINAREVLEAIAESAFKTSEYPVILSFENHCNPRQQAKIANYCRDIFGEMLLDQPLDSHKLEPGTPLPPPCLLKRKIIIKNKKKHHHHHKKTASALASAMPIAVQEVPNQELAATGNGVAPHHAPPLQTRQGSKDSTGTEEEESSSEEDGETGEGDASLTADVPTVVAPDHKQQAKETEAGAEISALVNYVQPVHFSSFENSEKKNRHYEMSSFDEKQATTLLKEQPIEFVNYNKNQLSRIYPAGTRFDSSNFMPQIFWNAGCQLVTLNYQTLDLAMQLNLGIFEYNYRSGYVLKPEFMRRKDRRLDPFAESTVDGIIAGTVSITVISGQFITDKRVGTYVEVDMYGLPADTVRKKFRTKIVPNNGINPVYGEEPFVFKKVVLPELACIRITAYEESGKFIGHRILPVVGLCPGYRHVNLRTELGQPLPLSTLFLLVVVKDYVPDGLSDFAEALANPIKYQSEQEKRAEQLAILTDDMEPTDGDTTESDTHPKKSGSNTANKTNTEVVGNGSPAPRHSISAIATMSIETVPENDQDNVTTSNAQTSGSTSIEQNTLPKSTESALAEEIVAEPLEKILENKLVKEKKTELDKKLEALRKKHEKEKMRLQSQKSGEFGAERRSKFYMSHKLVKRLSSKNISDKPPPLPPTTPTPGSADATGGETSEGESEIRPGLPRSQSERLIAAYREHVTQERELRERYHEAIYNTAEKVLRSSQSGQLKMLRAQLERETAAVMRKLQTIRRDEVKALAKVHRDRDELVRVKREVASAVVEKGVTERVRLAQAFERKRDELQRQHDAVKNALQEHRLKAKTGLTREFETRYARVDLESNPATSPQQPTV
ncbi:1-phosphatidylinositol 4,5-bisphosphate phosphodiesterase classes I and II isoform X2 [Chrysoperla carnea]|uniref:1-phosphatidylinositol 4,5-bisphosphate phosphodiesterase classes I and II isoform X2 n=1 Tax=Chrysoperla carnea TaxID=189513 RepID=UPI001D08090C|nr:1-phosphatidylinositol 4,5-bisphosphate phosphodiesterase classes I and II isoform X2 [Chrysoperla carnea]